MEILFDVLALQIIKKIGTDHPLSRPNYSYDKIQFSVLVISLKVLKIVEKGRDG